MVDKEFFSKILGDILFRFLTKEMKILEVGCGKGHWLSYLKKRGIAVVGVDVSKELIAESNQKGNVSFVANARALPFKPESFDCVYLMEVFQYAGNHENIISEISRVVKTGGIVMIESLIQPWFTKLIPARFLMKKEKYGEYEYDWKKKLPHLEYDKKRLSSLFGRHGLYLVSHIRSGSSLKRIGIHDYYRLVKSTRRRHRVHSPSGIE